MIHKYQYSGKNIVVDVNSGAVHVFDPLSWEILNILEKSPKICEKDLVGRIDKYSEDEIRSAFEEIHELIEGKMLFSEDIFSSLNVPRKPVVKALCLHIAHDCNLKCEYCFAGEGEYNGPRSLMDAATGARALDFLVENSGSRSNLEVDFFGGEPTVNFEAVKSIVEYGKGLEKIHNKNFRFTLTTNAFHITDEIIDFCNENMHNVVLSIDGRRSVNDAMRRDGRGNGSYDKIVPNIERFIKKRNGRDYYVRGTYTRRNLDFSEDVLHLYSLGFKSISLEPVVAPSSADYALREQDLPRLFEEYDRLTKIIIENKDLSFFHFNIDLSGGACAIKRISGCGAGCEYMAVTPDGTLYPCHQFVGIDEFKIGSVFDGVKRDEVVREFSGLNVYEKPYCGECWAKFYCSGGCAANSYQFGGSVASRYEIGCLLQKKRIECGLYLRAVEMSDAPLTRER